MAINIGFKHGIYTSELPTPLVALTQITTPTVAVGTAPIHLASEPAAANTPVLCSTLAEFVKQFGWSNDFENYTLCEVAKAHFTLYNVGPVIFINVLDPIKQAKTSTAEVTVTTASIKLSAPVIISSIKIETGNDATVKTLIGITDEDSPIDIPSDVTGSFTLSAGETPLILTTDYTIAENKITLTASGKEKVDGSITFTLNDATKITVTSGADYTAAYDTDGNTVITFTTAGTAKIVDDKVAITYREIDPSAVTSSTVVGGVDLMTGDNTGLECIDDIYPKLGVVPGTIIAPKFSASSDVAAVMAAKANGINGTFKAIAIADLPTATATRYTDVPNVKSGSNFANSFLVATWPKVALSGEQYHLSTQLAALMCVVDAARDNVPFKSPSNENLQCDSAVLASGKEVYLGKDLANYVNGQGVVTALNFGGWRSWGNHMSAYPTDTDPINFIAVRRMMNWICNTLVLNFFSRIDSPMNRVLVDAVLDSVQLWLNGLTKSGAILGGEIAFLEDDNPQTELSAGNMLFRLNVGFAVPAQEIEFTVQFNPEYFSSLFE